MTEKFQLPEGVTVEQLLTKYGEIDEALDTYAADYKAKTGPLSSGKEVIENTLHKFMLSNGMQNLSGAGRVAFFKNSDYVNVKDFNAVLVYLLTQAQIRHDPELPETDAKAYAEELVATGEFTLLTKGVTKTVVKDIMKESGDIPPPGVSYTAEKKLFINRK